MSEQVHHSKSRNVRPVGRYRPYSLMFLLSTAGALLQVEHWRAEFDCVDAEQCEMRQAMVNAKQQIAHMTDQINHLQVLGTDTGGRHSSWRQENGRSGRGGQVCEGHWDVGKGGADREGHMVALCGKLRVFVCVRPPK